jgi:hypothetical protein
MKVLVRLMGMQVLRGLDEAIGGASYPVTTEEVIEAHGDVELELPNGDERLADVLGRLGSETFESQAELRLATYSAVSSNAIGRKGYSDRDPSCLGETGHDQLSL